MRILVTGASGFIGSTLCERLRGAGHDVRPVSLRAGVPEFTHAGAVVHLAGIAHRDADAGELRRVNAELAVEAGRRAAAAGARFIFLSSVKVHGDESVTPFDERSPFAPGDPYGESKARAEEALHAVDGLDLVVLRPPLVYGPRVKANFLRLLRAIDRGMPLPLAGIENRRSLVYIGNLADAIARCAESPQARGRSFLVADGAAPSTPELCRAIGRALGRPARLFSVPRGLLELAPGARRLTRSLEVDDRALRETLGWHPPFTPEAGLAATARWYRGS